jgi:hypothetical protein
MDSHENFLNVKRKKIRPRVSNPLHNTRWHKPDTKNRSLFTARKKSPRGFTARENSNLRKTSRSTLRLRDGV